MTREGQNVQTTGTVEEDEKKIEEEEETEEEVEEAEEDDDTASWNGGAIRKDGGKVFVEQFQYNLNMVPNSCSETVLLAAM